MSQNCDSYLSTGHVIGLFLNVQASAISFISVVALGIVVLIKYYRNCTIPPQGPWRLLRSNLDAYMIVVRWFGGLIDTKWVIEKHTYCGSICSAQGALTIIGAITTAYFTTAIAAHTWISIYKKRSIGYSLFTWLSISSAVWIFVLLFVVLEWATHRKEGLPGDGSSFYRPTPFWCWISSEYMGARIGEYLWFWVCGFGNIAFYVPLFLFSRGNLVFRQAGDNVRWEWHFPAHLPSRAPTPANDANGRDSVDINAHVDALEEQALRDMAWKMLLYPCAYTIQILPLSIARWITFVDQSHSLSLAEDPTLGGFAVTHILFRFLFRLSGFINVLLIIITRPNILLFGSRGVLDPEDPRAVAEMRKSTNLESQDRALGDHLPQPDAEKTGGPSRTRRPNMHANPN